MLLSTYKRFNTSSHSVTKSILNKLVSAKQALSKCRLITVLQTIEIFLKTHSMVKLLLEVKFHNLIIKLEQTIKKNGKSMTWKIFTMTTWLKNLMTVFNKMKTIKKIEVIPTTKLSKKIPKTRIYLRLSGSDTTVQKHLT